MCHGSTNSKLESNLRTSGHSQNLGLSGFGESALVASSIFLVNVRVVANIGRWVGRELDGVVCSLTSEASNVRPRFDTVDDGGVEEVMSRCHLGDGGKNESGLHIKTFLG